MPWPHSLESVPPRAHAACAAATPNALTPSGPYLLPASHARLSTRQGAYDFNQPLSADMFNADISNWDTSGVTNTQAMFYVRSARARSLESDPPRARRLHRRHPTSSRLAPALHARLSTRQVARAFNQPPSFDTSKVTNMHAMFSVRSARALSPQS